MNPRPDTIAHYRRKAERFRREAFREVFTWLFVQAGAIFRYAVAPFALGRRMCSSSRGNISTKLHGRVR